MAELQLYGEWAETIHKDWVRLDKLVTIRIADWPDGGYTVKAHIEGDHPEVTLGIFSTEDQAEHAVRNALRR